MIQCLDLGHVATDSGWHTHSALNNYALTIYSVLHSEGINQGSEGLTEDMHDARKYSIEVNIYVLEDLVYCSLLSASVSIGVHCRFQTVKQSSTLYMCTGLQHSIGTNFLLNV